MLEIRIHGRGDQGERLACEVLSATFVRARRRGRVMVTRGFEPGQPADHVLLLDPSLLSAIGPSALRPGGLLLVNSPVSPCSLAPHASAIVCIDADGIARGAGLGSQVATAMLGAFAGATKLVSLVDLTLSLTEAGVHQKPESVEACMQGYLEAAGIEVEVT